MVTMFCPLEMTCAGKTALQTGDERFVVDCKVKPAALVGHVKIILSPDGTIASCGKMPAKNSLAVSIPAATPTPWPEPPNTTRVNGGLDPQPARG